MDNNKNDNRNPQDGSSKNTSNQDYNKPQPITSDPNKEREKKHRIGDEDNEKSREDQVLAKVNGNPDRSEDDDADQITNSDDQVTNKEQGNEGDDAKTPERHDNRPQSEHKNTSE
jgi:hypothetical protein